MSRPDVAVPQGWFLVIAFLAGWQLMDLALWIAGLIAQLAGVPCGE